MKKLSVSIDEDQAADLEERVEDGDAGSVSEALRERLATADRLEERVDELETDLEQAEARKNELENQLAHERDREDDVDELATFADYERRARRRREQRQEARRRAGIVERARWTLFGEPADLEERVVDDVQEERAPDRADGNREK